jgi:hypothetical protein
MVRLDDEGGPKPEFLKKRVAYHVAGLEQWKYADRLEDISNTNLTLYLHSDGSANDVFRSGTIGEQRPAAEPADKYTYDPLDVRPEQLERKEVNRSSWRFQSLSRRHRLSRCAFCRRYRDHRFREIYRMDGN